VEKSLSENPDSSISDLLATGKPTFSFEFFPPKDQAGIDQLARTIDELAPLRPDFVSVTYGANGSARDKTIDATRRIVGSGIRVMGHLTAASQTRDELKATVDAYAEAGVRPILAVRGDMPGGPTVPWKFTPGVVSNATELVELVASRGDFCIGVGAFPDIHPAGSQELDVRLLLDKEAAGASFAITQLFFTPARYFELVARLRQAGSQLPVIPGLMPITKIGQLTKFAELSGAPLPEDVVNRLQAVADDPAEVNRVGTQIGIELATELLRGGAPGMHFYTQNRSVVTAEILSTLLENPDRWSPAAG
jgi:methylenetetrahydrofolate reductase (NADPH)